MPLNSWSPALALMVVFTAAASAEEVDHTSGRYSMSPVEGGYLRLDTVTGEVAMCAKGADQWSCNPVDDHAKGSGGTDTARLQRENRELKDRVKALQDALEEGRPATAMSPRPQMQIPSEQEVDQALDYMERMFKKIRDRIKNLDKPLPPSETLPAPDKPPAL